MKIITILGARPQFIKAAPVSKAIRERADNSVSWDSIREIIVHTGQHFDRNMSEVFFKEMQLPEPDYNLDIHSLSHGAMTGRMLEKIEEILIKEAPDFVLVYGDTNSTIAGALAAVKLHIPLAHVEAGLRSFNRKMPEEHNRVITDHCADILFCPTQTAVDNLRNEGIPLNNNTVGNKEKLACPQVHLVGDTMYDAVLMFSKLASSESNILVDLRIEPKEYSLATLHRPDNTDNQKHLEDILKAFCEIDGTIVFPVHPRTRAKLKKIEISGGKSRIKNIMLVDPVGYLDMLMLAQNAKRILTDSGGIQKEAYFFKVPCITLRTETEWIETVKAGWNVLTSANKDNIVKAASITQWPSETKPIFGDGRAANKIVKTLLNLTSL